MANQIKAISADDHSPGLSKMDHSVFSAQYSNKPDQANYDQNHDCYFFYGFRGGEITNEPPSASCYETDNE